MFWKHAADRPFVRSMRFRLIVGYLGVFAVSVCILCAILYIQMRSVIFRTTQEYLAFEAAAITERIAEHPAQTDAIAAFLARWTAARRGPYTVHFALFSDEALLLARSERFSENAPDAGHIRDGGDALLTRREETIFYTCRIATAEREAYILQLGADSNAAREYKKIFLRTVRVAVPAILIVACAGAVVLTMRVFAPLAAMTETIRRIVPGKQAQTVPLRGSGDELDVLAAAFNHVLLRLHESYQNVLAFTADASHELRLPITTIKGEAEVVLERERDLGEYQQVLVSIIEEMNRLVSMINRLLLLTRADSSSAWINHESVDLRSLLARLIDFFSAYAETKGVRLVLCADDGQIILSGDAMRLEELFSNLIDNALKYTPENGSVNVHLAVTEAAAVVRIEDTGCGIPEDEREKIFERFYRINKARDRESGGAGLGLSIVRAIAAAHHGTVSVAGRPGGGSCFTVTIPL